MTFTERDLAEAMSILSNKKQYGINKKIALDYIDQTKSVQRLSEDQLKTYYDTKIKLLYLTCGADYAAEERCAL